LNFSLILLSSFSSLSSLSSLSPAPPPLNSLSLALCGVRVCTRTHQAFSLSLSLSLLVYVVLEFDGTLLVQILFQDNDVHKFDLKELTACKDNVSEPRLPALARARPLPLAFYLLLLPSFSRTVSVSRTVYAARAVSVFCVSGCLCFLRALCSFMRLSVVIRRS
jgi:hypothetical protein